MKSSKSFHCFVAYPESTPYEVLVSGLEHFGHAYLISPLHDSDLDENGEVKKAHWHVMIFYQTNAVNYTAWCKKLKGMGVSVSHMEMVQSPRDMVLYFCHADEKSLADDHKARYAESDLVYGLGIHSLIDGAAACARDFCVEDCVEAFIDFLFSERQSVDCFGDVFYCACRYKENAEAVQLKEYLSQCDFRMQSLLAQYTDSAIKFKLRKLKMEGFEDVEGWVTD